MDASRTIDAYRTGNFFHQIVGLLRLEAYKLQRKRKEVDNIRTAIKVCGLHAERPSTFN